MSEFSAVKEPKAAPVVSPPANPIPKWQRPIIAGLSLPWLVGIALILGLTLWYLFGPESTPSVNQLAFQDNLGEQLDTYEAAPIATFTGTPTPDSELSEFKNQVASMITGVRSYSETNREAIERLSEALKSQAVMMTAIQRELVETKAQNDELLARASSTPMNKPPVVQAPKKRVSKPVAGTRPSLAGMRLEAVQSGMAWVYWQDRTWAVKAGDQLGKVTISSINAEAREVHTNAGTLK